MKYGQKVCSIRTLLKKPYVFAYSLLRTEVKETSCRIKYVILWSIIVTTLVTASHCSFAMTISVIFTV